MKVIAFNGSPRKDGNTAMLIKTVFEELNKEGIDTELIQFSGQKINGCIACFQCFANKDNKCSVKSDIVNDFIEKVLDADGIILGSPTYFFNVTSEMKAFMDRLGLVSMANEGMLKRKVGASVAVARRAGTSAVLDTLNNFFLMLGMIIPGSNYPNMSIGLDKGDVEKDMEGIQTMKVLGENMAWLMKKICV